MAKRQHYSKESRSGSLQATAGKPGEVSVAGIRMREGLLQVELLNARGDSAICWIPSAPEVRKAQQ